MPLNTAETELCPACANLPELEEDLAPTFTIFNRERSHGCLCELDSAPHIWVLRWSPALPCPDMEACPAPSCHRRSPSLWAQLSFETLAFGHFPRAC